MKKVILFLLFAFSLHANAQFAVIRGVNPSNAFVNLNSDGQNNLAVNCVVGCGASSGTGGLAPNGSAVSGNPVLVAGYDGTNARTILTDTTGQQKVLIENSPAVTISGTLPAFAATPAVSISGTPAVTATISGTPAVTISGTPAVTATISGTPAVTLSGTSNAVLSSPTSSTLVDHSGTITTGGTAQTLSAAKSRHYLFVQNLSAANLYINFTTTAVVTEPSIMIPPNGSFVQEGSFVSSEAVSIIGATTGQAFTAKDF